MAKRQILREIENFTMIDVNNLNVFIKADRESNGICLKAFIKIRFRFQQNSF